MTTLKSLVDETTNIKNEIVECHSNLSSILTSKNVEVSEEDKMSDLIGKVDLLGKYTPPLCLYKEGNEYITFNKSWSYGISPTYTKNSDNLNVCGKGISSAGSNGGYVSTSIDITDYKTLNVEFILKTATNGSVRIGISSTSTVVNTFDANTSTTQGETFPNKEILSLDISKLSGNKYICVGVGGLVSNTVDAYFYKIWLEK